MTMTVSEISAQLDAIHAALVEKTGEQPWAAPSMHISDNGAHVTLYGKHVQGECVGRAKGDTFEDCIADAFRIVAALPDLETAALHRYVRRLGEVVDEGRAAGIPDEYTQPVSLTIKAVSDNLLPPPAA